MKYILAGIFILLVLAGCGGSGHTGEIRVIARAHPWLQAKKEQLQQNFRTVYKRDLRLNLLPQDNYDRHLKKALTDTGDAVPDFIELDHPAAYGYYQTILPLNTFIDRWSAAGGDEWFNEFLRLRTGAAGVIPGICIHRPEPRVLAVRADWLDRQQLEFPVTVEEMLSVAKSFTSTREPVYGLAWTGPYSHLIMQAYNGVPVQYDEKTGTCKAGFTGSVAEKELTALCHLFRLGALPPDVLDGSIDKTNRLFTADRLGILVTPLRNALALQRTMGKERVVLGGLPRGTVKPANGMAPVWSLVGLKEPAPHARIFLEWWYRPETFEILCGAEGDTAALPAWLNPFAPRTGTDKITALLYGEKISFNDHPHEERIGEVLRTYYHYAMSGSLDTRSALEGALAKTRKLHLLE